VREIPQPILKQKLLPHCVKRSKRATSGIINDDNSVVSISPTTTSTTTTTSASATTSPSASSVSLVKKLDREISIPGACAITVVLDACKLGPEDRIVISDERGNVVKEFLGLDCGAAPRYEL
jgi:hypothetical protein